METVAVLDFETTGLSPRQGDRATEIAILLVREDQVIDRFDSLMNAGHWIPDFVSSLTGITNDMIARAPPAAAVMAQAARFVGSHPIVAHNASFDKRFWDAELSLISQRTHSAFACTMLISRRIYPNLRSHKLQSLATNLNLPNEHRAHRALADAMVTSHLWCRLRQDISREFGVAIPDHRFLTEFQGLSLAQIPRYVRRHGSQQASAS